MIDRFASRFSMDPDKVYNKSFLTVMNFAIMWKEQDEFQDRINEARNAALKAKMDSE